MNKRTKKVLLVPLAVLSASFLVAAVLVAADSLRDEIHPADVAIVPGNTVESDLPPTLHKHVSHVRCVGA